MAQGAHQGFQRLLKLRRKSGRSLSGLGPHIQIPREDPRQEFILGHVDELEEIGRKRVSIFVQEAAGVVEDHAREMVQAEGGVDVRFGL